MARLYIADRQIDMADSTAAEFQEVLYRTLAGGRSFLYSLLPRRRPDE